MTDFMKISELQADALREVMNMGTGHAVNAIAQMLNRKVTISVPRVSLLPLKEVADRVAHNRNIEEVIIGLYFKILGDLSGNVLLIFPKASAQRLCWLLLGKHNKAFAENTAMELIEMEQSAMMEVGNILTNSYLNSLASITDLTLFPSIPHYAEDMLGAVLDYLLIEVSKTSDTALFMETEFHSDEVALSGDFLVFPSTESLEMILNKVGMD